MRVTAAIAAILVAVVARTITVAQQIDESLSPGFITELLFQTEELPGVNQPQYLSPTAIAVSPDGAVVYVANHTGRTIDFIDAATNTKTRSVKLPKNVTGLALSPDGSKLYATCFNDQRPWGHVCEIPTASAKVSRTLEAGHSPQSPVVSPDGATIYICNRFADKVSVIDAGVWSVRASIAVKREPFAAAITPDGKTLVVTNYLPVGRTDGDSATSAVSLINTVTGAVDAHVNLTNGAQSLAGVAISPDGKYAYIAHVRSNFTQTPLKPIEGGWINANGFSIVDIPAKSFFAVVLLDDAFGGGASNPWGVACDATRLCITTGGTQELHVLDRTVLHAEINKLTPKGREGLSTDLSFSTKMTKRKTVTVKGPRSVVLYGTKAYVAGYFSDGVDVVSLSGTIPAVQATIALAPAREMDIVRWGEYNFSDALRMCQGRWQSCNSCHPGARSDGLKWDLENDGVGNFKNDKSLLYAHITPPSMITGVRERADVATSMGVKLILFIEPSSVQREAEAIDEYLIRQRAVPSPYLVKGELSEPARRGKVVYESLRCGYCHVSSTYFTDMKLHAGVKGPNDFGAYDGNWDTPTLHEVWRTGPYLHDGRCATMTDLYKPSANPQDNIRHGIVSSITDDQLKDLVEYVNSL